MSNEIGLRIYIALTIAMSKNPYFKDYNPKMYDELLYMNYSIDEIKLYAEIINLINNRGSVWEVHNLIDNYNINRFVKKDTKKILSLKKGND